MASIKINLKKSNDEVGKFQSKFLGLPSIPENWLSGDYFDEEDIFLFQINLEDLKEFNIPFSKQGMLYFFINLKNETGKVLYTKSKQLVVVDFNEGVECDYNLNQRYSINFEENKEYYVDGTKLFGLPANNESFDIKREFLLLQFDTLDQDVEFLNDKDKYYQYVINIEDLRNQNFEKTKLIIK